MTTSRFSTFLLAACAAAALALGGQSCNCGGDPGNDAGQDAGNDGGYEYDGGDESDGGPTLQVLEFHGGPSRSGLYVDPGMTKDVVEDGGIRRDTAFAPTFTGQVYAQPLYFQNAGGPDLVIVATANNTVHAFNAASGAQVWQRTLPQPMAASQLPCGNISPNHGIVGTPVIDPAGRALYLSANVGVGSGTLTAHHQVFGLSVDDGSTLAGFPVDMNASAQFGSTTFTSNVQGQRSALSLLNGKVYVPYGGMAGDCGQYHGWVVGIPTSNPSAVQSWATRSILSGIWAVGGLASDGAYLYGATGNGVPSQYGDQETIIRFAQGPTFSLQDQDRFIPSDWSALDSADADISGSGPVLVNMPGSSPSALLVALGKDGYAYLINRANLGGQGGQLQKLRISNGSIIQAAAVYRTPQAAYVVASAQGITGTAGCGSTSGDVVAMRVNPGAPPQLSIAWCARSFGRSSPIVTTTDGTNEAIVWTLGTNDGRLRAFDGDTGRLLYTSAETLSGLRAFQSLILAKGRIFIGADTRVYAYTR